MNDLLRLESVFCSKGSPPSPIINNISFSVAIRARVTLVGPSGCGKSTLLRTIVGLDPVSSGRILFQGRTVEDWTIPEWRRRIGLVFQLPYLFSGTVKENLLFGPRLHHVPIKNETDFAIHYLDQVGLPNELLDRPSHQLSVGQQMRVSLARTLANQPQILLLDEPTSSLDEHSARQILDLINRLNRENEITTIVATHQLTTVEHLGGRVLRMDQGELAQDCPVDEFLARRNDPAAFSNKETG